MPGLRLNLNRDEIITEWYSLGELKFAITIFAYSIYFEETFTRRGETFLRELRPNLNRDEIIITECRRLAELKFARREVKV